MLQFIIIVYLFVGCLLGFLFFGIAVSLVKNASDEKKKILNDRSLLKKSQAILTYVLMPVIWLPYILYTIGKIVGEGK